MSYDNSKSTSSSSTRSRVARAEDKDTEHEADAERLDAPKNSLCGANAAHQRNGSEGGSSSPSGGSGSGGSSGDRMCPHSDDMDGLSSGNDSGERESEGGMERKSGSRGRQSTHSSHSSSNSKDSGMMLETTESNKSSNSQSLSPPSGSLAYSMLSNGSEHDPPSTSGCSSNQSARLQTQKDLMKAIKELKLRLPSERKTKGHTSTLHALKYALQCVRQVRANKEYYHQWSVEECHGCSLDLSAFTIEELDNITSEYTLKNSDTFSMAVSFLSGKVVYVSPHGSSLLRCKPERLQGTVFSELLAPQDISTFYSSTAPCRLPTWASCIGSASPPMDCTQEKSMFCRISADRTQGAEIRYYPFRLTPYQLTLRDSDAAEPQPCCLLIAERVHSGYEAPRIPADKRIFTTSHTPSCLFQEVDERAVPLLGHLPQDLAGTPLLLYIHPDDRPMMVAIHEKIFQFAGQPFDYSPLRMCARSGEYVTLDTSWSSFVNPWSRKVTFIVGRHKVRTSPLNEDVFTLPHGCDTQVTTPDIVQLSEQIHRLLVQPIHSGGSQGYSSLGSSVASSLRAINSDPVKRLIADMAKPPKALAPAPLVQKEATTGYSYQQINCLDSIIRYLESCNIPNTVKRKCGSSSCTASSTSDDDKQQEAAGLVGEPSSLPPLTLATKAESVASVTSQCSFSSTIVHVGDKKPPESGGSGSGGRLGLTKEVLSAHTQQEEQAFLDRFKDLSKLRVFDQTTSSTVHCPTPATNPLSRGNLGTSAQKVFKSYSVTRGVV
uniref:Period circadian clock 1b n=1 Tax=Neogobius melanostomus TaxID=47308 RepID=A0A8C6UFI3_9GOBI